MMFYESSVYNVYVVHVILLRLLGLDMVELVM